MLPVRLAPALWAIVAVVGLGGVYFVVDFIGDVREVKVHARYAKAAEATNIDVRAFNSEDDRVAAISEAIRQKVLDQAKSVPSSHLATKEQAKALTEIRWP